MWILLNEETKERKIEIECRRLYKVAKLSVEQRVNIIQEQNKVLL